MKKRVFILILILSLILFASFIYATSSAAPISGKKPDPSWIKNQTNKLIWEVNRTIHLAGLELEFFSEKGKEYARDKLLSFVIGNSLYVFFFIIPLIILALLIYRYQENKRWLNILMGIFFLIVIIISMFKKSLFFSLFIFFFIGSFALLFFLSSFFKKLSTEEQLAYDADYKFCLDCAPGSGGPSPKDRGRCKELTDQKYNIILNNRYAEINKLRKVFCSIFLVLFVITSIIPIISLIPYFLSLEFLGINPIWASFIWAALIFFVPELWESYKKSMEKRIKFENFLSEKAQEQFAKIQING